MCLKSLQVIVLVLSISEMRADQQWFYDSEHYSHSNGSSPENHKNFETIVANNTELNQNQSQIDYSGRSAKSIDFDQLFPSNGDGGREPRIINDKELSIKGFIPIVGFGNDKHDSEEQPQKSQQNQNYEYQSFTGSDSYSQFEKNNFPQQSTNQKHISRPEDQRFIGAALQGLTASLAGKPTRKQGFGYDSNYGSNYGYNNLNGNEGCVCVPFYMCKNGYLTEAKNSGPKSPNIQTAQSILNQFSIPAPHSYGQQKPSPQQNPFEQYLPIDERSNDDLNVGSNHQTYSKLPNDVRI